eukprot:3450708-Rhodomonas_salina.1
MWARARIQKWYARVYPGMDLSPVLDTESVSWIWGEELEAGMEAGGWEWRRLEGGEGLEGGDSMQSSFVVSGQLSRAHPDRKDRP